MTKRDEINIDVVTDPRLLASVRGLVRTYLQTEGFSSERASEIVLAVDEACTNAIRHAYGGNTAARLSLTVREQDSAIEFIVKDEGVPVALEKCERRAVATPDPTLLKPGGLGVQLIYSVFDEVEFHPGETSGNRVVMRVKRPEKKAAQ